MTTAVPCMVVGRRPMHVVIMIKYGTVCISVACRHIDYFRNDVMSMCTYMHTCMRALKYLNRSLVLYTNIHSFSLFL